MTSGSDWDGILKANAEQYARVAIANIGREFPYDLRQMMSEPGDFPNRPKDRNPIFYGSLDWHSCVEMHWLLVRLLRSAPDSVPADDVRAALDRQFSADAVAGEIAYVSGPDGRSRWQKRRPPLTTLTASAGPARSGRSPTRSRTGSLGGCPR
jgi:hypothetical protein